ncbi:MAG: recombinase family protein [Clostridiales bacterium]|nr:recombinase family protein [Clostridiales bacterium]
MCKNFYGYIRVSSVDQNEARQVIELTRYGIIEKNIFLDKQSGKDFNRPQYQRLKKKLRKGDVLIVKSIDRLGRNYEEIQNEWRQIVKEIKADIVVLDMPILDTRTNKDLIGTLISDIVLQLLSYVAQSERESIKQRQAEGIAAAKARGVHLGRIADPIPAGFRTLYEEYEKGALNRKEASARLGVSLNQFDWMLRKYRKKK